MVTFIVYSHMNWFSKDVMSRFQIPTLEHICCIYCVKMMFEIPKYFWEIHIFKCVYSHYVS